ncbi:O-antigen export protein [Bacteroidia bacterium]|nr:O-antigen export protein [Bacteroidia bacterium]
MQRDTRTIKAQQNIIGAVFLKGFSVLVSFVLVPMTLGYLNAYEYGVWLTLSSVLMWINYFDVGLGHGLRNKLAEAFALKDDILAKIYVSTVFFLLTVIVLVIYLLFILVLFWLDWYKLLNVSPDVVSHLNSLVLIVFTFFCLSFVLKFIGNIYLAKQLPVINDLLIFAGNFLSLIIIYILTKVTEGNLSKVAITYSVTPVLAYLIAYPITFYIKYPFLRPTLSAVKLKYAKGLMGLGLQFFVIQIACLLIFSTSNILISHLFGSEDVTYYNIASKYFLTITMIFGIVITPIWSAITDAYVKNDYGWMRKTIRTMLYVWVLLFLLTIVMVIISNYIYHIWVGDTVKIPMSLSVLMGLYVTIMNWNNIYTHFINGTGKIRLQLYITVGTSLLYIPLAIFLSKIWGINGIIGAMCIILLCSSWSSPLQYYKIINKKAKGIWNK